MFRSKGFIIFIVAALLLTVFLVWRWGEGKFEFSEQALSGVLAGKVTIGPFCPAERINSPCPGPPGAYTSREVLVFKTDGKTQVSSVHLDASGNYSLSLASGEYLVRVSPAGIGQMPFQSTTIKPNEVTKLDFSINTGIR